MKSEEIEGSLVFIGIVGDCSLVGALLNRFPDNHVNNKVTEAVNFLLVNILPGVNLKDEAQAAQERCIHPIRIFRLSGHDGDDWQEIFLK